MKRFALAAAAVAAALTIAACTPAKPVTGVIVGKDYDRGSCSTKYTNGKPTSTKCKNDEYELDVRTDQGKIREVDVDPYTFQQVNIGDRWPKGATK